MGNIEYRQPLRKKDGTFIEWWYWDLFISPAIQQNGLDTRKESEQYAGIKDKTGKKIYSNDVIKVDDHESIDKWMRGEIGLVKFIPSRFTLCLSSGDKKMLTNDFEDCVTVIGNICENPKLNPLK